MQQRPPNPTARIRTAACLAALAGGCAGAPEPADRGFPVPATAPGRTESEPPATPTVAPAAASTPPATADETAERALERELRTELADSPNPTAAALELVGLLSETERHAEALAVVAAARRRSTDPVLRIAAAGLYRDLGQRHTAVAELVALREEQGALSLHPSLLFELAELQWLEGAPDDALATLAELRRAHADSDWLAAQQGAVESLQRDLGLGRAPTRMRVRDLLGNLRGAPSPLVRQRTLEEVVRLADGPDGRADNRLSNLRDRAIAIACGDPEATVRARAIQLAMPTAEHMPLFCRAALADADPKVRAFAAERTAELHPPGSPALLFAALQHEVDPAAFRAQHDALARVVAGGPTLPDRAEHDPDQRRAAVAAWKERCTP